MLAKKLRCDGIDNDDAVNVKNIKTSDNNLNNTDTIIICGRCNKILPSGSYKCEICGKLYYLISFPNDLFLKILKYHIAEGIQSETEIGKMARYHCQWRDLLVVSRRWNTILKTMLAVEKEVLINIESMTGPQGSPTYTQQDITYMRRLRLFNMYPGAERLVLVVSQGFVSLGFADVLYQVQQEMEACKGRLKIETLVLKVQGKAKVAEESVVNVEVLKSALLYISDRMKTISLQFPYNMSYRRRFAIATALIRFSLSRDFTGNVLIDGFKYKEDGNCEGCRQPSSSVGWLLQGRCDALECIDHRYLCSQCLQKTYRECGSVSARHRMRVSHSQCLFHLSDSHCIQDAEWCQPFRLYPDYSSYCGLCVAAILKTARCPIHPALCANCEVPIQPRDLEIQEANRKHFALLSKYLRGSGRKLSSRLVELSKSRDVEGRCVACEMELRID